MRSNRDRCITPGLIALLLFSATATARADADDDAEALARARYFDSFPYEQARALTDAGAARLIQLIADPAATDAHPNAILALGVWGQDGAFEALVGQAEREPEGDVSSAVYRSRVALRIAMGHLAQSDDRALGYLIDAFQAEPTRTRWRYSVLDEGQVARKLRRDAASGLAVSGRPAARAALEGAMARGLVAGPDSELRAHVAAVLDLHRRVERDGGSSVFRGEP